MIIKPIKKEETKPVLKIEQQKPITKNVPAAIKKEGPKLINQIILKKDLIILKMLLKSAQMN